MSDTNNFMMPYLETSILTSRDQPYSYAFYGAFSQDGEMGTSETDLSLLLFSFLILRSTEGNILKQCIMPPCIWALLSRICSDSATPMTKASTTTCKT